MSGGCTIGQQQRRCTREYRVQAEKLVLGIGIARAAGEPGVPDSTMYIRRIACQDGKPDPGPGPQTPRGTLTPAENVNRLRKQVKDLTKENRRMTEENELLEEAVKLNELNALCNYNRSYLCRLFHQETGFRMTDYLTSRRLNHAIKLLLHGESVSAAARLSGFHSDSYFIMTFKKNAGATPYQYVKMHRNDE